MKPKEEYANELHKAIESLSLGRKSDAQLWLTNFYFKNGGSRQSIYVPILRWTLADTQYQQSHPSIRAGVAKILYFIDTSANNEANTVFVKRTGNGYVIERKSSS